MKKNAAYIFLIFLLFSFSCQQSKNYGDPTIEPAVILKSFNSFWTYLTRYVRPSEDFTALNIGSEVMTKDNFLKLLSTGDYLPLRLNSRDSSIYYKLYKLSDDAEDDIKETIKNWANVHYAHFKMEGHKLPDFDFIDLNGNEFNRETTSGKILILKCWFIGCVPCVQEMPALNKLVDKYKDRKDILFVSLAFDSKKDLQAFLKKTNFGYAVVPDQKNFVVDTLQIQMFPTHLIINKKGLITKVVNNYEEMAYALNKEALK